MSTLYYDIPIDEAIVDDDGNIKKTIQKDIPHFKQIKAWLPFQWRNCQIHTCFDGILKDKIENTAMRIFQDKDKRTIARVKITFIPGFRLSEKRRQACWEQLDAQMTDGFGESYYLSEIPDVDPHYRLDL